MGFYARRGLGTSQGSLTIIISSYLVDECPELRHVPTCQFWRICGRIGLESDNSSTELVDSHTFFILIG